jgi:Beta propeller domain
VGQVGNLGRGERIYAVRFLGDVGYVVTFRQVDPLYTIDLSDPGRPRVVGELKIPGYSAYLHPVGEGLLLGVGQDATDEGRRLGAQVSLFDVSDPARPERLDQIPLGQGSTQAEFDHHAFLWWAPRNLAVLPLQLYAPDAPQFSGAVGVSVEPGRGLAERGRLTHAGEVASKTRVSPPGPGERPLVDGWPGAVIQRSLVIDEVLYTVSDHGVLASSVADLSRKAWVGF